MQCVCVVYGTGNKPFSNLKGQIKYVLDGFTNRRISTITEHDIVLS